MKPFYEKRGIYRCKAKGISQTRGDSMTDEKKLMDGIHHRRRGALERAIDIYTPYISAVIYNMCGAALSNEDIEEIVSDTFVALWRSAQRLEPEKGTLRSYLGAIARNLAKDRLSGITRESELNETIPSSECEPSEAFGLTERRSELIRAVTQLGEPDSEIFIRYYFYGERITHISKAVGVCANTVKTKLARGRKKLKDILERMWYDE